MSEYRPESRGDNPKFESLDTEEARIGSQGSYDPIYAIYAEAKDITSSTYTNTVGRNDQAIIPHTNALNTAKYDGLAVSAGMDIHAPYSPSASVRVSETDEYGNVESPVTGTEVTEAFDRVKLLQTPIGDVSSPSRLTIEGKTSDGNELFLRGSTIYIWGRVL